MKMKSPSTPGDYAVKEITYNSEGVYFDENNDVMGDYLKYNKPDDDFIIRRRVDLSSFRLDLEVFPTDPPFIWPFNISNTPLMGIITLPWLENKMPAGKFPLVVFLHGNHSLLEDSAPGYSYLCELLSSNGIICCSVAQEYLLQIAFDVESGYWFPENGSRVISLLEHVKQFRIWNSQPGHPLEGKVDLDNIMLVGHSRGGETVADASTYNKLKSVAGDINHPEIKLDGTGGLGPYFFNIQAIVSIAPTFSIDLKSTFTGEVVDNYFILNGMRDADVYDFQGYETYSLTNRADVNDPYKSSGKDKGLWWVSGANHNYFNSLWTLDMRANATISPEEQREFAKVYIASIAYTYVLNNINYKDIIKDHTFATEFLMQGARIISQYQGGNRIFIQHNQEGTMGPQISEPFKGSISSENILLSRFALGLGEGKFRKEILLRMETQDDSEVSVYSLSLNPSNIISTNYSALSITIGLYTNDVTRLTEDYNFLITIKDSESNVASFDTKDIQPIFYPDVLPDRINKIIPQTLRIDFSKIESQGVNVGLMSKVDLIFPSKENKILYSSGFFISD